MLKAFTSFARTKQTKTKFIQNVNKKKHELKICGEDGRLTVADKDEND